MNSRHIYINPRPEGDHDTCPFVRKIVRRFVNWLGRDRLPIWMQKIVTVAGSSGTVHYKPLPESASRDICSVMTVISANLWHDWPRFKILEERLEKFAQLVIEESADLVLVQELVRIPHFFAAEWLAERLNMGFLYSRVNGSEKIGFEEGLGIFSRFPLIHLPILRQVSKGCNPFVRRMILGSNLLTPCGELLAFSVHLSLFRRQNSRQIHDLQHWVGRISQGRSVIIGGDFNAPDHVHRIRQVRTHWIDAFDAVDHFTTPYTHSFQFPWGGNIVQHRLDYIFLQRGHPGWRVIDVAHLDAPGGPHSDHRAVRVRFAPEEFNQV